MSFLVSINEGGSYDLSLANGGDLLVQSTANVGPGTGPTPATQQTAWFQDYVAGNDVNDGKTAATAVQHAAEIKRRWTGGVAGTRVQLPAITITITALSNAPDFTDPYAVLLDVDQLGGGRLVIQCTPVAALHTGTLATASAFARTSAAGQIVITDAGVPDWHAFPMPSLFVDTTGNGIGWLYEPLTGSSANGIVSPLRTPATPGTAADAAVTVNAGDAYQLVPLVSLYIGGGFRYRTFPAELGASAAHATLRRVRCIASAGFEVMVCEPENYASLYLQECRLDVEIGSRNNTVLQNSWSTVAMFGSQAHAQTNPSFFAGGSYGELNLGAGQVVVDKDYVFDTATVSAGAAFTFPRGAGSFLRIGQVSSWGLATVFALTSTNVARISGLTGADTLYGKCGAGNPIFQVNENGLLQAGGFGSFANAFSFDSTTFVMNATATAFAFNPATGLYVGPTTCTTAHVDAAIGIGTGFGNFATDPRTGAQVNSFNG